jgi:flagellin-like protein
MEKNIHFLKANKQGLSPVIATVLLVLLTVSAGAILLQIIVPYVTNTLDESAQCYKYGEHFYLKDLSGRNCFIGNNSIISVGAKSVEIEINGSERNSFQNNFKGFN